jgi:hypothetical protein
MKLRAAEGVPVPALFSYAVQEFGEEFFGEAWDEFFLWNDSPQNLLLFLSAVDQLVSSWALLTVHRAAPSGPASWCSRRSRN